MKGHLCIM